jgi:hypothetical protein
MADGTMTNANLFHRTRPTVKCGLASALMDMTLPEMVQCAAALRSGVRHLVRKTDDRAQNVTVTHITPWPGQQVTVQ